MKKLTPEAIKRIRKKLGLTQRELGDLVGVTTAAVCNWERGLTKPSGPSRKMLEAALAKEPGIALHCVY